MTWLLGPGETLPLCDNVDTLLQMPETAEVKAVIEHIGKWQVMLLLLVGCNNIIVSINHTLPTFQGYTPSYFCQVIYSYGIRTSFT
jgi:hypothetical protein